MESLRLFANHSHYTTHKSGLSLPNVAHCIQEDEVHYGPLVETRVIAKINVESTTPSYSVFCTAASSNVSEIEIDDGTVITEFDQYQVKHRFNTTGEHTIYYTLIDPTSFDGVVDNTQITAVTIPDSVTYMNGGCFSSNSHLENINIGKNVEYIGGACNFAVSSSFTGFTIPNSLKYIGYGIFGGLAERQNQLNPSFVSQINAIYNSDANKNYIDKYGQHSYNANSDIFYWNDCGS